MQDAAIRWPAVDWLRVLALMALIPLHAAIPFKPGGLPLIQNDDTSQLLNLVVIWLHEFRLPLLFLIAGMGAAMSLRRRRLRSFLTERCRRLLIPLAFGVLVVVPPMVYLEKRFIGAIEPGLADFYQSLLTAGVYPQGNLSWHHYWFIAYLFLFCLAAVPVVSLLRKSRELCVHASRRLDRNAGLFALILPLALIDVALRASYPGFPDLIHDWANLLQWFAIFMAGYAMALHPTLFMRAAAVRRTSLALAIALSVLLYLRYIEPTPSIPSFDAMSPTAYGTFCLLRSAHIWCWLLALCGLAERHLNRDSALLRYLRPAVFPVFCVHLPLTVAIAYVLVGLPLSLATKYCVLVVATGVLSLCLYEYCLRRWPALGLCFGLSLTTRSKP